VWVATALSSRLLRRLHPDKRPWDFFTCPDHRFISVSINGDLNWLRKDYDFKIANVFELQDLVVEVLGRPLLRKASLKTLTSIVMGVNCNTPCFYRVIKGLIMLIKSSSSMHIISCVIWSFHLDWI
jgi:hypothetical protein